MEGMEKLEQVQLQQITITKNVEEFDEYELSLKDMTGAPEYDYASGLRSAELTPQQLSLERNAYVHQRAIQLMPISEAINMSSESQMPVTAFKPAKKSYKQRREDAKQLEILKKRNPEANQMTLDVYNGIKMRFDEKDRSYDEFWAERKRQEEEQKMHFPYVDNAILRGFCRGYKVDKKGMPITEMDRIRKEQDMEFMADYCSMDVQKRWKHLDRMLDNILRFEMTEDKTTDEYIQYHAGELKDYLDKLVYFENVMKDEINKPYFEQLPPWKTQLLEAKYDSSYASNFTGVIMAKMRQNAGVNMNGYITMRSENGVLDEKMGAILTEEEKQLNNEIKDKAVIDRSINSVRIGYDEYKKKELKILDKYTDGELREAVLQKELSKYNDALTVKDYEYFRDMCNYREDRQNSMNLRKKTFEEIKTGDTRRILKDFVDGYKVKEGGDGIEPLDEIERARMVKDMELIDDYTSKDQERINKAIRTMIAKVVNVEFDPNLDDWEYVGRNLTKLSTLGSRTMMVYNMIKLDKRNAPYFDNLDETTKKMLYSVYEYGLSLNAIVNKYAESHGFSSNKEDFYTQATVDGCRKYFNEDVRAARELYAQNYHKLMNVLPQLRRMYSTNV